ncbi:TetR/AcrR family transcriptional regulator [uncultured Secundilactobacillus sp.]|uniref:TetR/AcrR family transcriptional regulator n=1 Tax=uncultured Secundilactobacillus sp. TaxID=2813935 RepID=UPI0025885E4B|nr:TetR/AcrR family transcriptional regulator [uncultured Secundilactobacillus sp.]
MVRSTFSNLSGKKQDRIRQALLMEFSEYALVKAQVARIVETAGISRGAFYTYFADLTDAYQYLLETTLQEIHMAVPMEGPVVAPDQYIEKIRLFFTQVANLNYLNFFQMHYRFNVGVLGAKPSKLVQADYGPARWAIMTLYHQTIQDCILDPNRLEERLTQLQKVLEDRWIGGV